MIVWNFNNIIILRFTEVFFCIIPKVTVISQKSHYEHYVLYHRIIYYIRISSNVK